jgi:hypothetical protein
MPPKTVKIAGNRASIREQRHCVEVPPLCPKTQNPLAGSTVEIRYTPRANVVLEVYSLTEYIHGFHGSQVVRDIEQFALVVAEECGNVLGAEVEVKVEFVLDIGQRVTTTAVYAPD